MKQHGIKNTEPLSSRRNRAAYSLRIEFPLRLTCYIQLHLKLIGSITQVLGLGWHRIDLIKLWAGGEEDVIEVDAIAKCIHPTLSLIPVEPVGLRRRQHVVWQR